MIIVCKYCNTRIFAGGTSTIHNSQQAHYLRCPQYMKEKREEEAAKPKLTKLKKPEEKSLKKAIEEGEVKELPDKCPKCNNKSLLTEGDTIWCRKCDYEWFP